MEVYAHLLTTSVRLVRCKLKLLIQYILVCVRLEFSSRNKIILISSFTQVENFCPLRPGRHMKDDCEIPADKDFPDCGNKIAVCIFN